MNRPLRKSRRSAAATTTIGMVAALLAAPARAAPPTSGAGHVDRSGMNEHVYRGFWQGAVSGGLVGLAASDPNDGNAAIRLAAGAALGGAAGVVVPILRNREGPVRSGDVVLIHNAFNWGLLHGLIVPATIQLFDCGPASPPGRQLRRAINCLDADDLRLDAGIGAALGLSAGALAGHFGGRLELTPGQASGLASAALWGGHTAASIFQIIRPRVSRVGDLQLTAGTFILGGDGAAVGAWYLRHWLDIDRARWVWMDVGGLAFGAVGMAAGIFLDPHGWNDSRLTPGLRLVGSLGGLALGYWLTSGMDRYRNGAQLEPAPPPAGSLIRYGDGEWALGVPLPRFSYEQAGRPLVELEVAHGTF
jgi:hypothetical protein